LFLKPALARAEQALARLLDDRLVLRNGPGIERVFGTILDSTSSMRRDVCGAPSSAERAQDRESLTRRSGWDLWLLGLSGRLAEGDRARRGR
jgi:hypothetical protein